MTFFLPVPRLWFSPAVAHGNWVYLAGGGLCGYATDLPNATGRSSEMKEVSAFEKINVITGEVIKLKDIRSPSYFSQLIK